MPNFCLGRQPADPAALAQAPQLAHHMRADAPPPPRLSRAHVPFVPGLDRNDQLGNCTAVGLANCARSFAILNGYAIGIPTDNVVRLYSAFGYNPNAPLNSDGSNPTDQGAVELDVLAYQRRHGFDTGSQTLLVGDFATFDPSDRALFANAMAKCGALYLGVDLAVADQDTGVTWDTKTPGDQRPGSWGGHCLVAWDYTGLGDTDTVRLGTWGMFVDATWRWIEDRCEEAHVLIWRQLMAASGRNLAGLDYAALEATNASWATA